MSLHEIDPTKESSSEAGFNNYAKIVIGSSEI